jgi:dolichol-phosphate mannosyltransferase
MQRPVLSVVIPLFNEEQSALELGRRLGAALSALDQVGGAWEVVFVDDGSSDGTPALLATLAGAEPRYRVLRFSRNFGHQAAITAGVDHAEGEHVVVMDADLQDPPEVVADMLARAHEGYDVVYGVRKRRKSETLFKRVSAAAFYRFIRVMTGVEIPVDAGDFRLMKRSVVLTLRALREQHRFVRGMVAWVGFRQSAVFYERDARFAGKTKYPLRRMVRFAVDGITSFSVIPLRLATWLGLVAACVAVLAGIAGLWIKIFHPQIVLPGWTGIMVALTFGFSAQLLMTGILGEYIGRIYEEVKRRPLYVVERTLNLTESRSGGDP